MKKLQEHQRHSCRIFMDNVDEVWFLTDVVDYGKCE